MQFFYKHNAPISAIIVGMIHPPEAPKNIFHGSRCEYDDSALQQLAVFSFPAGPATLTVQPEKASK